MAVFIETVMQELRRLYRRRRREIVRQAVRLPARNERAHHLQRQIESTRCRQARPAGELALPSGDAGQQ